MKATLDFIVLWAEKIWRFTQVKNFIYFWAIIFFLASFFIETSFFALVGFVGSAVALVSNIIDKDDKEE